MQDKFQPEEKEYLLSIQPNDALRAKLQAAFDAGRKVKDILLMLDEVGEAVYEGVGDKNSYRYRFPLIAIPRPIEEVLLQVRDDVRLWFETIPEDTIVERIKIIKERREREKHAVECEAIYNENPPKLETAEDYIKYFESFPKPVLEQLIKSADLELSEGCSASCLSRCLFARKASTGRHIPFEALRWIVEQINPRERMLHSLFYFGSDIKYYESMDKDGVKKDIFDVYRLFKIQYIDDYTRYYNSISFGLDKPTVNFILRAFETKYRIHRISRLDPRIQEGDIEKLWKLVSEEAAIRGQTIDAIDKENLENAFKAGVKQFNTFGGKIAMKSEEKTWTNLVPHCDSAGVVLSTSGFKGYILVQNTKYSKGMLDLQWPIIAKGGEYRIPLKSLRECLMALPPGIDGYLQVGPAFLFPPRYKFYDDQGALIDEDITQPYEQRLIDFNTLKERVRHINYMIGQYVEYEKYFMEKDFDLNQINGIENLALKLLNEFRRDRLELAEKYKSDIRFLASICLTKRELYATETSIKALRLKLNEIVNKGVCTDSGIKDEVVLKLAKEYLGETSEMSKVFEEMVKIDETLQKLVSENAKQIEAFLEQYRWKKDDIYNNIRTYEKRDNAEETALDWMKGLGIGKDD